METRNGAAPTQSYDPSASPPADSKASVFEDFIDIFHAPSQVFARRARQGFGLHMLLVSLLAAAFAFANRGYMTQMFGAEADRTAAKMMADNPRITPEMLEQSRSMQEGAGMVFGYIGTPLIILVMALFAWLLARFVAGARISYGQAALITTLAWIPRLVGMFVTTVQVALMDTSTKNGMFDLAVTPARFMDAEASNPKLYGLAGSFELFSVWSLILIGIGIAVVGNVPRSKGYIAAAILFILGTIPLLMR
ncbi:MAG TPA: Yip1 family protein [Gemmatimonadaceae bacterium]|nr:Yip1 family protein [Gemmatimonadaceae bacterium]